MNLTTNVLFKVLSCASHSETHVQTHEGDKIMTGVGAERRKASSKQSSHGNSSTLVKTPITAQKAADDRSGQQRRVHDPFTVECMLRLRDIGICCCLTLEVQFRKASQFSAARVQKSFFSEPGQFLHLLAQCREILKRQES